MTMMRLPKTSSMLGTRSTLCTTSRRSRSPINASSSSTPYSSQKMALRSPRSRISTEWMYPPWRTITEVISYSTPVRSTPRQTIASGGRLVEFAGGSATGLVCLFVDAEQTTDGLDDGHMTQRRDRVLDCGFVGDVGGQDDFCARHVIAQNDAFLLDYARQADAAVPQDSGDRGHDAWTVQGQQTQEVARLE